jgi:excisionase family DNA binding protein
LRSKERITAFEAALILGVPLRTVQALAAHGQLPTAARIGRRWTFNEAALRTFIRNRELETEEKARLRTGHPKGIERSLGRSAAGRRSTVRSGDGASGQAIQKLLARAAKRKKSS